MKAVLFWHGQYIDPSANNFKYWRGWVAETNGIYHFCYQYGRMREPGRAGSSRVGRTSDGGSKLRAEGALRDKVHGKTRKGYQGTWYYQNALEGFDFPLDVAPLDWQLPVTQVMQVKAVAKPKPVVAVQPDDALSERRSPLSIGWRLDL